MLENIAAEPEQGCQIASQGKIGSENGLVMTIVLARAIGFISLYPNHPILMAIAQG